MGERPGKAGAMPPRTGVIPLLLLALVVVGFRFLGAAFPESLPNFQPLPALLLCSIVFLRGPLRWVLPLAVWLITDPVVSLLQGYPLVWWHHLSLLFGLAATVGIALAIGKRAGAARILGGTAAAALAFYFVTNCASFVVLPNYPKTLEGFVQAQWTGPAGFGPTWVFLRNALASNLLFTALLLAAARWETLEARTVPEGSVKKAAD
ncbi:MAG: hypothetical protein HKO57_01510 [Akkermansiaceae bacterium]|nr:hypothetical protein [Akkermansiaceae bacterium]